MLLHSDTAGAHPEQAAGDMVFAADCGRVETVKKWIAAKEAQFRTDASSDASMSTAEPPPPKHQVATEGLGKGTHNAGGERSNEVQQMMSAFLNQAQPVKNSITISVVSECARRHWAAALSVAR